MKFVYLALSTLCALLAVIDFLIGEFLLGVILSLLAVVDGYRAYFMFFPDKDDNDEV
jgi:hypothetical protein